MYTKYDYPLKLLLSLGFRTMLSCMGDTVVRQIYLLQRRKAHLAEMLAKIQQI